MTRPSFLPFALLAFSACEGSVPPPAAPMPPVAPASTLEPAPSPPPIAATPPPAPLRARAIPLPGVSGAASLDYLVYEPARSRVWVPVGNTGSVDVLDTASGTFTPVDGFKTVEREVHGKKRMMGPSAAAVGDGFVFVGDRGSSEVCPVDAASLKVSRCLKLTSPPDGIAYVAAAKEVWVTTPKDQTLTILDASKPATLSLKATVKTDGDPEGLAVDDAHGRVFTNMEDRGGTVVVDVKTRKVTSTWNASCGSDGPRGVAYDGSHDFAIVACTDHVQVLDAAHDGALLGRVDAGAGIDNIDCLGDRLYIAAGKASSLTVASVDAKGQLTVVATGHTSEGARNAVADSAGNAYVADPAAGGILVLPRSDTSP